MAYRLKSNENPWEDADMKNGMLTDKMIANTSPTRCPIQLSKNISHSTYTVNPINIARKINIKKLMPTR